MVKPYTIILHTKILEHPSLVDLKSSVSEDDWDIIIGQTAQFYLQMDAVNNSRDLKLDKYDQRIYRSLARTLAFVKRLDPALYNKYCSDDLRQDYREVATKEIERCKDKKLPDSVIVSRLD